MNSFQEKILELRKSKNYTQEDLAKILYVSRQAVSKWENGISYPSMDIIYKIAEVFDISADELFDSNDVRINTFKNNAKIKNIKKTSIIISIITFLVLVISIIGLITARKAYDIGIGKTLDNPKDFLVGFVVITSDSPKEVQLDIDNIETSGYPYLIRNYENNALYDDNFGLFNVVNASQYIDATIYVNSNLFRYIKICDIYKSIKTQELYIDQASTWFGLYNGSTISLKKEGLERIEEVNYKLLIKTINTVESIKLIEFDINNNIINEVLLDEDLKEYTISNDCLYIVFEEKQKNAKDQYFYTRDIITSAQINEAYFYSQKFSNDKGFAHNIIKVVPTLNN